MFGIADNHEFLTAIGVENTPNRDAIVANLEKIAQQKLTIKISEKLTPTQLEELNNINNEEQVANWLADNLPDFPRLVTEALSEMKNELLSTKSAVLGLQGNDMEVEKGELITLSDNKEYVCLSIIMSENKKFLYLMTTSEPIKFCFAEEISINDTIKKIRIVGRKDEKQKLFNLLKTQLKNNPNQGLRYEQP